MRHEIEAPGGPQAQLLARKVRGPELAWLLAGSGITHPVVSSQWLLLWASAAHCCRDGLSGPHPASEQAEDLVVVSRPLSHCG